mgnify:CR=1 FL=1
MLDIPLQYFSMETPAECSICKNTLNGKYCSNCGQEFKGSPISFGSVIFDFISNVFSLERSVFAAMFRLVKKPKQIICNYWEGNRKYYPSPGKVFFYSLAIGALHISFVNKEILGATLDIEGFKSHFFFWLIFMPLFVFSSFLVYIKRKKSFVKNITSHLYLASTFFALITVLQDLVNYLSPDTIGLEAFPVFFILIFIWNTMVFDSNKSIWIIALNAILQILIFISFLTLIGLLIKFVSPEAIK